MKQLIRQLPTAAVCESDTRTDRLIDVCHWNFEGMDHDDALTFLAILTR